MVQFGHTITKHLMMIYDKQSIVTLIVSVKLKPTRIVDGTKTRAVQLDFEQVASWEGPIKPAESYTVTLCQNF